MNIVNKINADWEEEYLGLTKGIGKLNNTVFFYSRPSGGGDVGGCGGGSGRCYCDGGGGGWR